MGSRFIPTRVGQMIKVKSRSAPIAGSSPRVWGRCEYMYISICQALSVHPHACGADCFRASCNSTPHPVHPHACGADCRRPPRWRCRRPVHPHACGADGMRAHRAAYSYRFIPTRVGQIQAVQRRHAKASRFIPTRVGQMSAPAPRAGENPSVHPHACGADDDMLNSTTVLTTVHPHACGADVLRSRRRLYGPIGSSPRVWGRYFPKCSYDWILINCKPSKSMIDRRGFPYVSMVKPCSLLVE